MNKDATDFVIFLPRLFLCENWIQNSLHSWKVELRKSTVTIQFLKTSVPAQPVTDWYMRKNTYFSRANQRKDSFQPIDRYRPQIRFRARQCFYTSVSFCSQRGWGWLPSMHHRSHDQGESASRWVCLQVGLPSGGSAFRWVFIQGWVCIQWVCIRGSTYMGGWADPGGSAYGGEVLGRGPPRST